MDKKIITDWLDGGCSSWGIPEQNIRKLVNSHDKLVEALRDMIVLAEATDACLRTWNGTGSPMNYEGITERARAALEGLE
jgi:hypothetical protein